jgi:hypothetical protein
MNNITVKIIFTSSNLLNQKQKFNAMFYNIVLESLSVKQYLETVEHFKT